MGPHGAPVGKKTNVCWIIGGPMVPHGAPVGQKTSVCWIIGGPINPHGVPVDQKTGVCWIIGGPMGPHGVPVGKKTSVCWIIGGPMGPHGVPVGQKTNACWIIGGYPPVLRLSIPSIDSSRLSGYLGCRDQLGHPGPPYLASSLFLQNGVRHLHPMRSPWVKKPVFVG